MAENECPLDIDKQKTSIYAGVKGATAIVGYPLDVIRTRIYTDTTKQLYFAQAFRGIHGVEGVAGFYKRGFGPSVLRMGGKEAYRGYGFEYFGHSWGSVIFNSALDTIAMPLDKVKTLQQNAGIQQSFLQSVRQIHKNGFLTEAYKGASFYFGRQLGAYSCTIGFQSLSNSLIKECFYKDSEVVPFWPGFIGALGAGFAVASVTNPLYKTSTRLQAELGGDSKPTKILLDMVRTYA